MSVSRSAIAITSLESTGQIATRNRPVDIFDFFVRQPFVHILAESVDRLAAEVRVLRDVLAEVREDFSWVTRNGLPIRPVELVHVRRMPCDINADDWATLLVIDRFALPETAQASPLESDSLDDLARNLTAAFEAPAKGQLEPVLRVLDGVRTRLVAMLHEQAGNEVSEPVLSMESLTRSATAASPDIPAENSSAPSTPPAKQKRGQLF